MPNLRKVNEIKVKAQTYSAVLQVKNTAPWFEELSFAQMGSISKDSFSCPFKRCSTRVL